MSLVEPLAKIGGVEERLLHALKSVCIRLTNALSRFERRLKDVIVTLKAFFKRLLRRNERIKDVCQRYERAFQNAFYTPHKA